MGPVKAGGRALFTALLLTAAAVLLGGCTAVNEAAIRLGMRENPYAVEVSVDAPAFEEYRYSLLDPSLQPLYREMVNRIAAGEDSGPVYAVAVTDEFWEVMDAVTADHPEFFWLGGQTQVTESGLTGHVISYELETTVPAEERGAVQAQLEEAADMCIASIPEGASEYEIVKAVYEYLIGLVDYDLDSPDNQNIQSALLGHRSVCAGYARSFEYILHRMGMFCIYVTGHIIDRGDHAWNIVCIDGQYYNVDVTWGDPGFLEEGQNHPYEMNYYYLCCPDWRLEQTHQPEGGIMLPSCYDDSYNYYRMNGMYYDTFDPDEIYGVLMDSVESGQKSVTMLFGSGEAYQAAMQSLFEEGLTEDAASYVMRQQGLTRYNYYYYPDEVFHMITIVWF